MMKLKHIRIDLAEANTFVEQHHRHHKPVIWDRDGRPRVDKHPLQNKLLFERIAAGKPAG